MTLGCSLYCMMDAILYYSYAPSFVFLSLPVFLAGKLGPRPRRSGTETHYQGCQGAELLLGCNSYDAGPVIYR